MLSDGGRDVSVKDRFGGERWCSGGEVLVGWALKFGGWFIHKSLPNATTWLRGKLMDAFHIAANWIYRSFFFCM